MTDLPDIIARPAKTRLLASVAFQDDRQMGEEVYRFYIGELAFMHPDTATDNILRRGVFAPGGIGDPDRHVAALKARSPA